MYSAFECGGLIGDRANIVIIWRAARPIPSVHKLVARSSSDALFASP